MAVTAAEHRLSVIILIGLYTQLKHATDPSDIKNLRPHIERVRKLSQKMHKAIYCK